MQAVSAPRFEGTAPPRGAPGAPLLEIRGLTIRFGGVVALDAISFAVEEGEILGVIGPNGAGKTTLFNCLTRLYEPTAGEILLAGRSLLHEPPHRMARLGICRTFQNLALFARLSVLDNVRVGQHTLGRGDLLGDAFGLPGTRRADGVLRGAALELLDSLGLAGVAHCPVASLPVGTQKRVELARALASRPRLLLLDEPASGLDRQEVAQLGALIRQIRERHALTVLLVEHRMDLVMAISDRVIALDLGRKIAEGKPEAVRRDPEAIRAYLGSVRP